jgi:site-specific DNA-methyltransferase (adenine-specific)
MPISEVYNEDNMIGMKRYHDKYFDLAIVDPPYGININMNMGRKKGKRKNHIDKSWDNSVPDQFYFDELFRVSKNQIIWGGNYFALPLVRGWIVWNKNVPQGVSFADGELAWTSFDSVLKIVNITYSGFQGMDDNGKIHPTQKPIKLYKWLILHYLNGGGKVIDTHLGSGSSRIACYDAGVDFWGWEIDFDYYNASIKRFEFHKSQLKLF